MPHPAPEDRQLMAVVRRLLAESDDDTEGPLRGVSDTMLSAIGPPECTRGRALRYARAVIDAAVVEARLADLADKLADAEWQRSHAEAVSDRLVTRLELGDQQVVTGIEDEISDDINALISLADGAAWVRDETVYMHGEKSKYWHKAEASTRGAMSYEWPFDGGPFIALPDHWYLRNLVRLTRQRDEDEDKIRDLTRSRPGYEYPYTGGLAKMIGAVLHAADRARVDLHSQLSHERQKLYDIRRAMADTDLTAPQRHARIVGILERPAHDADPPAISNAPRCHECGHQPHSEQGCWNMASDNDCACRADSLGGPVYDGDSDRVL